MRFNHNSTSCLQKEHELQKRILIAMSELHDEKVRDLSPIYDSRQD